MLQLRNRYLVGKTLPTLEFIKEPTNNKSKNIQFVQLTLLASTGESNPDLKLGKLEFYH